MFNNEQRTICAIKQGYRWIGGRQNYHLEESLLTRSVREAMRVFEQDGFQDFYEYVMDAERLKMLMTGGMSQRNFYLGAMNKLNTVIAANVDAISRGIPIVRILQSRGYYIAARTFKEIVATEDKDPVYTGRKAKILDTTISKTGANINQLLQFICRCYAPQQVLSMIEPLMLAQEIKEAEQRVVVGGHSPIDIPWCPAFIDRAGSLNRMLASAQASGRGVISVQARALELDDVGARKTLVPGREKLNLRCLTVGSKHAMVNVLRNVLDLVLDLEPWSYSIIKFAPAEQLFSVVVARTRKHVVAVALDIPSAKEYRALQTLAGSRASIRDISSLKLLMLIFQEAGFKNSFISIEYSMPNCETKEILEALKTTISPPPPCDPFDDGIIYAGQM